MLLFLYGSTNVRMRKQYHFRPGAHGLQAWDVHKLIAATAELQPEILPLAAVQELDETYWYETDGSMPTCRSLAEHMRLVQEADLSYPIIIGPEGRVMDGMHRVVKALLEGRQQILAYRLRVLPAPDYVGVAPDDLPYEHEAPA